MSEDQADDLPDPIPEVDDQQVAAPAPPAVVGEEVFIEDTAWYKLNDSVMSRNHRDRKLTKVQRHIKSGHIGVIPNCPEERLFDI